MPGMGITRPGTPPVLPAPYATRSARNPPNVVPPPEGKLPTVPEGYRIAVWTRDVEEPRNMVLAPNGDVFVAESRRNRVFVFRDADGNGTPDRKFIFAEDVRQPFGIAFYKNWVYVARTDSVVRFPCRPGQTKATGAPEKITDLTPGGYRQHWTRNIIADPKRGKLYVSVGSASNASPEEPPRAGIIEMNPDGSGRRMFATGLRNPVGLAINPQSGKLWTAVNERDGLGDDLPPDYMTEVRDGGFYGWPYYYIGKNHDPRLPERPELQAKVIVPDVLLGPHTAALNLAFNPGTNLPGAGDAFVALHGSWNRSHRDGYKVLRVRFRNGRPVAGPEDFVTGFVLNESDVWGRPVGLLFLKDGSLLVSEDGNDTIYRVSRQ
jgi:glucose/arabinose dehydrogenase